MYRTPGGHRRFTLEDLRRFLAERTGQISAQDDEALVEAAVGRVRAEIQQAARAPRLVALRIGCGMGKRCDANGGASFSPWPSRT